MRSEHHISREKFKGQEFTPSRKTIFSIDISPELFLFWEENIRRGLPLLNEAIGDIIQFQDFSYTEIKAGHKGLKKHGGGHVFKTKIGLGDMLIGGFEEGAGDSKIIKLFLDQAKKLGINIEVKVEGDNRTDLGARVEVKSPLISMIYPLVGKSLVKEFVQRNNLRIDTPKNLSELAVLGLTLLKNNGIEITAKQRVMLDSIKIDSTTEIKIISDPMGEDGWITKIGEPEIDSEEGNRMIWTIPEVGEYFIKNTNSESGISFDIESVKKVVAEEASQSHFKENGREMAEEYTSSKIINWMFSLLDHPQITDVIAPSILIKIIESSFPDAEVSRFEKRGQAGLVAFGVSRS